MKKVFVIGSHGHVGRLLVPKLAANGDEVLAGVRNQAGVPASINNVTVVQFNLNDQLYKMAATFKKYHPDAIVFSAGSGGRTGDDQTLAIDLDGAIKTMIAARQAGVKRYIMVSAAGSDDRSFWEASGLQGYYIAKHYADDYLKKSDLSFTILRPTALTDDDEKGQIKVDPTQLANASIARADVANAVVTVLHDNATIGKVYTITNGNTPIRTAF